jgi:hypothetical protein
MKFNPPFSIREFRIINQKDTDTDKMRSFEWVCIKSFTASETVAAKT